MYGYDDCGLGCVYVNIGAWLVILKSLKKGFGGEKSVLGGIEALRACG